MKWTKRTAALLASLLLLSLAAQAQGPAKAKARTERGSTLIQIEPDPESPETRKIPVLAVLPPAPEITLLPEEEEPPAAALPEVPAAPAEETAPLLPEITAVPAAEVRFPEAEDWQLLLVNPWNELPEDYEVRLKKLPDGLSIDVRAYDALNAMLQACRDAGLSPKICSAYRTQAKQTALYNNKIARLQAAGYSKKAAIAEAGRWVARPGTSEHQLGLAVDIVSSSYQGLTKKQESTAEQKWLMEHCWEYGFILRYPNDKSEITGIGYEPWHYRYVGTEVAQDIRASGLCMEEYLLLREETLGPQPARGSTSGAQTSREEVPAEDDIWTEIV